MPSEGGGGMGSGERVDAEHAASAASAASERVDAEQRSRTAPLFAGKGAAVFGRQGCFRGEMPSSPCVMCDVSSRVYASGMCVAGGDMPSSP